MRLIASLGFTTFALASFLLSCSLAAQPAESLQSQPTTFAQTPPMGWNEYNYFHNKVDQAGIRAGQTRWFLPA
jgi:hypothetical protein